MAGVQRRIIDGLKRGPNPPRIQQGALGKLRGDDGVMSNPAKLALIAGVEAGTRLRGTAGDREARGVRCADRMHQGVQQNVHKQQQQ